MKTLMETALSLMQGTASDWVEMTAGILRSKLPQDEFKVVILESNPLDAKYTGSAPSKIGVFLPPEKQELRTTLIRELYARTKASFSSDTRKEAAAAACLPFEGSAYTIYKKIKTASELGRFNDLSVALLEKIAAPYEREESRRNWNEVRDGDAAMGVMHAYEEIAAEQAFDEAIAAPFKPEEKPVNFSTGSLLSKKDLS